jgi:hypothetical protein
MLLDKPTRTHPALLKTYKKEPIGVESAQICAVSGPAPPGMLLWGRR